MSLVNWILNDLYSLLPLTGTTATSPTPNVGDQAPADVKGLLELERGKKAIVAFQRHTGCPFAEKTIRRLASLASADPTLSVHIVLHSPPSSTASYTSLLFPSSSPLPSNVHIHSDPERRVYAAWGVGQLGWTELFTRNTFGKVIKLARDPQEPIKNRFTVGNRWQNHGTFALDEGGKVRFVHIGRDAGDMTDVDEAVVALKGA